MKPFQQLLRKYLRRSLGLILLIGLVSYQVVSISQTSTTSVSVVSGWNLLGNGTNTAIDPTSVAPLGSSNIFSLWKWDATNQQWGFYTPTQNDGGASYAASKGYTSLSTINPGEGFWVNANQAFSLPIPSAASYSSTNLQLGRSTALNSGWNLISVGDSISPCSLNLEMSATPPAVGSVPINFTSLWAWDPVNTKWFFYAPSLDAAGTDASYASQHNYLDFSTNNKFLGFGTGFWVNMPAASSSVSGSVNCTAPTSLASNTSTTTSSTTTSSSQNTTSTTIVSSTTTTTGGGGGGGTSPAPISIGGKVIDGYISGANICLDVNRNGSCDPSEPSATSSSDGSYSLNYVGDTTNLHIISSIPTTAKDSDDNGQTLAQAGKQAFTMLAPAPTATSTNTVITPLTTLVSAQMLSSGVSATTAQTNVINSLGLTTTVPTILNTDYVASNNTVAHQIAQVTAAAIGASQATLSTDTSFTSTASAAQAATAAIQYIVPSVVASVVDTTTGKIKANLTTTSAIAIAQSAANSSAQSSAASVAVSANLPTASSTTTLNFQKFLNNGFIVIDSTSGQGYIDANGNLVYSGNNVLEVSYNVYNPSAESFNAIQKILISGQWFSEFQDGTDYDLTSNGWVPEPNSNGVSGFGAVTFNGNCVSQNQTAGSGAYVQTVCATLHDISGLIVTSLIPSACTDGVPINNCSSTVFPSGSLAMDVNTTYSTDAYRAWVNDGSAAMTKLGYPNSGWDGYGYAFTPATTSLNDFLSRSLSTGIVQWYGNNCNTGFKFTAYSSDLGTGTIAFDKNTSSTGCSNATASFTSPETVSFSVKTVNGQQVAVFVKPVIYATQNFTDHAPLQFFAAITRNGDSAPTIWQGGLNLANVPVSLPFSGNTKLGTPSILDTLLKMTGRTAFPYTSTN